MNAAIQTGIKKIPRREVEVQQATEIAGMETGNGLSVWISLEPDLRIQNERRSWQAERASENSGRAPKE